MRREFSKEFKRDAVSLVIDQGYSQVDAARSLDIHSALLSRWVREHTDDGGDAFRGKGKLRSVSLMLILRGVPYCNTLTTTRLFSTNFDLGKLVALVFIINTLILVRITISAFHKLNYLLSLMYVKYFY